MSLCWEGFKKRSSRRKTFNEYMLLGSCDLIHYFILWMPWVSSLLLYKCIEKCYLIDTRIKTKGSFLGCQLLLRDGRLSLRLSNRSIFSILGSSWLVLNENQNKKKQQSVLQLAITKLILA